MTADFVMEPKKINIGCLKIFKFIELLYNDEAYYDRVIEIFQDEINNDENSNNVQVILNKHINTLKVFGIKITKKKNKYKMLSSLYSVDLSPEDLKSMSILIATCKSFPDKKLRDTIKNFINTIEVRMKSEDKNTLNNLTSNSNYDFSFFYTDLREQINQCLKICEEQQIINILYIDSKNKEIQLKCHAKEVLYESRSAFLKVFEPIGMQNLEIPIPNILSITVLPNRSHSTEITQTVIFKLKDRLAKTYKMRECEQVLNYDDNSITIKNTGEPFDSLLSRLMRYSYNCEIISPKSFKDKMITLINDTLSNYESDITPKKKTKKKVKKKKED